MQLNISDNFKIDADKIVTGRTCIIGQSGSGKSYAVAVFCEELAKNNIGFCIIDIEGEYFSLKEKYSILWVGSGQNCDINIDSVDFNTLSRNIILKQIGVIFDVSDVINPNEKVQAFLKALYQAETQLKLPYLLIIEEIDKFAPQNGKTLYEIEEISRRGRKRGLGLMIATQRPALVNKNILSQCNNQLIGKLTLPHDLDAVKIFFLDKNNLEELPRLTPGYFFIQGDILPEGKKILIRERETKHKAMTPSLNMLSVHESKSISELKEELFKAEEGTKEETKDIFNIKINSSDAINIIKNKTKGLLGIGKEATILSQYLELIPIFECEVKFVKNKIIGKDYLSKFIYFNALNGDVINPKKGIKPQIKIKNILGLNSIEINLVNLIYTKERTMTELEANLSLSENILRKALQNLIQKGLITFRKEKNFKVYYKFSKLKLPSFESLFSDKLEVQSKTIKAKIIEPSISLDHLHELIKGLKAESEIITCKTLYYPIYRVLTVKNKVKKSYTIDACTGEVISF